MTDHALYDRWLSDGIDQWPANLNEAVLSEDGNPKPIRAHRRNGSAGAVECLFTDLERHLVACIGQYPMVVGCMAWLTNEPVLRALAQTHWVQIVVQKEDFLRPDSGGWSAKKLRALYEALPAQNRLNFDTSYSTMCGDIMGAIRCAGVRDERGNTPPRMHHKFLVFCDVEHVAPELCPFVKPVPRAVWTGSFNATHNGSRSLENAVLIHDENISRAYFNEWRVILGLSEPLDWEQPYMQPEYRIGT